MDDFVPIIKFQENDPKQKEKTPEQIAQQKEDFFNHVPTLNLLKSTIQMLGPGIIQQGVASKYFLVSLYVESEPTPRPILAFDRTGYDFMDLLRAEKVYPAEFQCSKGTIWVNPEAVNMDICASAPASASGEEQTTLVFNDEKMFVVFGALNDVIESLKTSIRFERNFSFYADILSAEKKDAVENSSEIKDVAPNKPKRKRKNMGGMSAVGERAAKNAL